ncbi:MAG: Bro-N domain-containing protein, partial [Raoultibacter sp.]
VENKLTKFKFGSSTIRVVYIDDAPWFVAEDICKALKLSNPTMSMKSLDEDERSKFNLGRQGEANVVSESGMYTLVLRCRDAVNHGSVAHRFRKWVTSEVYLRFVILVNTKQAIKADTTSQQKQRIHTIESLVMHG